MIIEPPTLETLPTKPSWVNRAGRVDRSACLDISAAEIWRLVAWEAGEDGGLESPAGRIEANIRHRNVPIRLPARVESTHRRGSEKSFSVTLTAHTVMRLLASRQPRRLAGDFRTGKSNAMQPTPGSPEGVVRKAKLKACMRASWTPPERSQGATGSLSASESVQALAASCQWHPLPDVGLPGNPNAGVSRTKTPGLRESWRQTLRIERHRRSEQLVRHFVLCPRCREPKVKLFLPLCTEREWHDAQIAAVWLQNLRTRPGSANAPGSAAEARVIERYAMLLGPRELRCAQCWGLRYGEARKG